MERAFGLRMSYVGLVIAALSLLGVLAGCGVHKPFEFMDDKTQVKKGTLAVVSGDPSEPTVMLTAYLTQELRQRSTFRVLGQEEMGKRIAKYPIAIKRADPENEDSPVWFPKTEKSKLDAMQTQLKADYLLVLWTNGLSKNFVRYQNGGGKVYYSVGIVGNLIEYPKAKAVGYSVFANSKDQSCCLFGKSEGDDVNEMLKDSAHEMADEFLAAAKAEKPSK